MNIDLGSVLRVILKIPRALEFSNAFLYLNSCILQEVCRWESEWKESLAFVCISSYSYCISLFLKMMLYLFMKMFVLVIFKEQYTVQVNHFAVIIVFSISTLVLTQNSLKNICSGFEPVTPLFFISSLASYSSVLKLYFN